MFSIHFFAFLDPVAVRLWDVRSGVLRQEMRGHENGVRSVAYSNQHKVVLSAGFDHHALVWNAFLNKGMLSSFTLAL